MERKYLSIISLFLLFLVSCTQEDILNEETTHFLISAEISSTDPLSRANIGIDGKGTFENGDAILLKNNGIERHLTLNAGQWTPSLTWDDNWGDQTSFSAFYPPITQTNGPFRHTVQRDQSTKKNFENSDLLYAKAVTVKKNEKVQLDFRHLMSCLTLKLTSNVYSPEQLDNATVKIKCYDQIEIYPETGQLGTLIDHDHGFKGDIPEITFQSKGKGIHQAIVCPMDLQRLDFGQWWLTIQINGKNYYIKEPPKHLNDGTPFNSFKPGKNTTLTYHFNQKTPDLVWGGQTKWVHGLKSMPSPESSDWKVYYQDKSKNIQFKHLPWDPQYGWYDINKKDSRPGSQTDDRSMCWAASASNMIHWWLDRNRQHVDKFCSINGIPPKSIPQVFTNRHESEVFDIFKASFEDYGSFTIQGLNWYLFGEYDNLGIGANLEDEKNGGYFKKVFNADSKLTKRASIITIDDLSAILKEAFTRQQAIGFEIDFQTMVNGHAMTIWGASFDKYGEVSEIYYVDNDDGEIHDEGVHNGLIAARVGTYEGKNPTFNGRACIRNSVNELAIPINSIILLDMGTKIWEKYFSQFE